MPALLPASDRLKLALDREPPPKPGEQPRRKMVRTHKETTDGVGDHFYAIVKAIDIDMPAGCACKSTRARMNQLGPDGCRREFDSVLDQLRKNAEHVIIKRKWLAWYRGIRAGLAFKVNPLDPLPGMLNEAIRRAEEQSKQRPQESLP